MCVWGLARREAVVHGVPSGQPPEHQTPEDRRGSRVLAVVDPGDLTGRVQPGDRCTPLVQHATVDIGVKRTRPRFAVEISASPLVVNTLNENVVAVATEQNSRPVAPLSNRSMMLDVSSEGPEM